jgi:hypothetical protein
MGISTKQLTLTAYHEAGGLRAGNWTLTLFYRCGSELGDLGIVPDPC